MARNIFEILEIAPTNDFEKIKNAYEKKEATLDNLIKRVPSFKRKNQAALTELNDAWAKVDSKIKLNYFCENGCYLSFESLAAEDEVTTVFIPVPIQERGKKTSVDVFKLARLVNATKFQKDFDYSSLALALNEGNKKNHTHVGFTFDEAELIVNSRRRHHYIIVQATVAKNLLSDHPVSENSDAKPNMKAQPYYLLKKDSQLKLEDIISVAPIKKTSNQLTGYLCPTHPKWLWPKMGGEFIAVLNPKATHPQLITPLDSNSVLPKIKLSKNKEVKTLQQAVLAMQNYAKKLTAKKPTPKDQKDKSEQISALAHELCDDIDVFILNIETLELTKDLLSSALESFKKEFTEKLHRHETFWVTHRHFKDVVIGNILIALTGIGLIALLVQCAYSYGKTGNPQAFFATTQSMQKVGDVAEELDTLTAETIIPN